MVAMLKRAVDHLGSCLALDISSSSLEMDWWLCSCGTRSARYEQRAVRLVGLCNNRRPCTSPSAPSVLTSGKTVQAAAYQNGDNVRGDGLSAHRRHFVLGARHLMWDSARAPLQCGHSSPRALLLRSRDVESSGQPSTAPKVKSRTFGEGLITHLQAIRSFGI